VELKILCRVLDKTNHTTVADFKSLNKIISESLKELNQAKSLKTPPTSKSKWRKVAKTYATHNKFHILHENLIKASLKKRLNLEIIQEQNERFKEFLKTFRMEKTSTFRIKSHTKEIIASLEKEINIHGLDVP